MVLSGTLMQTSPSGPPLPAQPAAADVLQTLLAVSLTGVILFRPVYDPAAPAELIDLAYVQLNPAAQRMLRLPECPADSFRTLYPHTGETGVFAFYRDTFLSGQAGRYDLNYSHDGLDNYFQLAAQRCGDVLVVSFTDTADQPRTAVEEALRQSQAREQQARRQLEQLNQELEARVFERTQALGRAQAEAVAAAQRLLRVTESLPSTSFTADQSGHVLYISPQWYAYTGMAPGAPIGEVWPRLIHPDDLPAVAREYGAALAEGRPWGYEFRLRGADGQYRWFASQGVPEPLAEAEAAGRLRQWFGSNLDIHDLKQAQQAQQMQEQLLSSILTALPADVVTFEGEALRYTFFNEALQRRVAGRAVLGGTLDELFPEAAAQGYPDLLRQVLRTAAPYRAHEAPTYVQDPRTGEREETFLDLTYLPLRHGQEPPHGVLGFAVDVTERVRARQQAEALQAQLLAAAQRQTHEREGFYQVFEQTPALIQFLRSPSHRIEYVNPAYQRLFAGRPLVGLDLADALPEVRAQGFIDLMDRVYQTGETYSGMDVAFVLPPFDGQPARTGVFSFTYQAYQENGQTAGISVFAFEVTEQVLARRQREELQLRQQELFEQAPVAMGVFSGPDYVVEVCNPRLEALWGRAAAEVLHRPVFEVMPMFRDQGLRELLDAVRTTGIPYVAHERLVQVLQQGTRTGLYLDFVYQPLRDAQGRITAVAAMVIDVSEQVAARRHLADANAGLSAANRQLLRTNADLDTFVYTASHDLKQPIANIEGLLHALREELPAAVLQSDDVTPMLDRMQRAVERFHLTIAQLTDVSRLQQADTHPAETVDLITLVEDVRQDLAADLAAAGASLTVDVVACPSMLFAAKHLRSIVYNLLSNAVKYRHPARPPVVHLRCHSTPTAAILEVTDNGLGLNEAQQARLYGMFQRLHDHVEGSGIGLYMVKRIVENAGGTIAVRSQPGTGTTFTVTLPAPAPAPESGP